MVLYVHTFIYIWGSFTNVYGWSAAVEYIVRSEQGNKMTQSELGDVYNVSVATVRKYVQAVKRTHT